MLSALLAIVLIPAAPVSVNDDAAIDGVVVDAEERPVEGASVLLSCGVMADGSVPVLARATADAEGRFRMAFPKSEVLRLMSWGSLTLWAYRPGSAFAMQGLSKFSRPSDRPIKLTIASPTVLSYKVPGPDGKPTAGVRIAPRVVQNHGVIRHSLGVLPDELVERLSVQTDIEGCAVLSVLPTEYEIWSTQVTLPNAVSMVFVRDFQARELETIPIQASVGPISGRVLDGEGMPVSGVAMNVWSKPTAKAWRSFAVVRAGSQTIRTREDGTFEVAESMPAGHFYRVAMRLDGFESGESEWVQPAAGESTRLPDVVLRRFHTVDGRTVDRQGNPVAGAKVFQSPNGNGRSQAVTDNQGRFQLRECTRGEGFVFVERERYRCHGQPIEAAGGTIQIVLSRMAEPPARSLSALPSVLPADEERELARRLIRPYAQKVEQIDGPAAYQTLAMLCEIDPAMALALLEKKKQLDDELSAILSRSIVLSMVKDDPEEALAVATAIKDKMWRGYALVDVSNALPASERIKKLELLQLAALEAGNMSSPSGRVNILSEVGRRLFDLGETERAEKLLREAQSIAEKTPDDPNVALAGWQLATNLAPIDLASALKLIKDTGKAHVRDRPYLFMAVRLASINPSEAERVLELAGPPLTNESYDIKNRVCFHMARKDLPRARRIAATIDEPIWKARALVHMAYAVRQTNKQAAVELLGEAFAELSRSAQLGDNAAEEAAGYLPIVEQVDSTLLDEYLWRSLSMRSTVRDPGTVDWGPMTNAKLARSLSLYDRELGSRLLGPALAWLNSSEAQHPGGAPAVCSALALIDPHRAVKTAGAVPDSTDQPGYEPRKLAVTETARMLSRHGAARQREIMKWSGILLDEE